MLNKNKLTLALLWPKYGGDGTSVNDLIIELDKKRFNIIFIYLRGENVENNALRQAGHQVIYISNKKQLTNLFIKPLEKDIFKFLLDKSEVIDIYSRGVVVDGYLSFFLFLFSC